MVRSKTFHVAFLMLFLAMVGCSTPKPITSDDIPLYPDATPKPGTLYLNFVIELTRGPLKGYDPEMDAVGNITGHRQYVVNTTLKSIEDFYEAELEKNGWKRITDFPEKDYGCLVWKRGSQAFLICSDFNQPIMQEYHTYLFNRK